ncbi:MAG: hypothetical protein PVH41_12105 [Anaerolineae bacterium]
MRTYNPDNALDGEDVCVSARIGVDSVVTEIPTELWFRLPIGCADCVADYPKTLSSAWREN